MIRLNFWSFLKFFVGVCALLLVAGLVIHRSVTPYSAVGSNMKGRSHSSTLHYEMSEEESSSQIKTKGIGPSKELTRTEVPLWSNSREGQLASVRGHQGGSAAVPFQNGDSVGHLDNPGKEDGGQQIVQASQGAAVLQGVNLGSVAGIGSHDIPPLGGWQGGQSKKNDGSDNMQDEAMEEPGPALMETVDLKSLEREAMKDGTFFNSSPPLPLVGGHTCRDSACSEFLSTVDWIYYKYCVSKTVHALPKNKPNRKNFVSLNGNCRFMDGSRRAPVALVSFPGSGNTWMRGLLEQATGICTGAIYCDTSIRAAGFTGERLQSGSVLVVKAHYHRSVLWTDIDKPLINDTHKVPSFGAAVFIIRNPFDAIVADWQRFKTKKLTQDRMSAHVDALSQDYFGNNYEWNNFVPYKAKIWRIFFSAWVVPARHGNHPLHVVRYEDLKLDPVGEVRKILDFLGIEYSPDEVKERLEHGFSKFRRKKKPDFERYTPRQKTLVRDSITKALTYLRKHNKGVTYGIESYLDH